VPTQNRVWRYQRPDLGKHRATENLAFDSQTATLVVVEEDSAFADLFSENLVLGAKVFNHLLLLPIDPAGEDNE
jgi:hypothetical protein